MNSTIYIVIIDSITENDKWQKAFKNYLAYALNEKHNIKVSWKTSEDILNSTMEEGIVTFILGVYSAQNVQDQQWQSQITQLHEWQDNQPNAVFYKILKELINAKTIPKYSKSIKQIAFYAHDTKSGELISEDILLSSKINQFLFKTFELAKSIALRNLKTVKHPQTTGVEAKSPAIPQTVFLSQVSPQSSPLREKLKQELISQGFRVKPEVNYSIYSSEERRNIIYKDLKQSNLVIHLFGEEVDHRQDGINDTIEAIQNEVSAKYSKEQQEDNESAPKRIMWITNNKFKDEQYKRYITNLKADDSLNLGGDIYQCTIEELKDIILNKLKDNPILKTKAEDEPLDLTHEIVSKQVYIIPDVNTESDLYMFKDILEEKGFSTVYLNNPKTQQEAKEQNDAFLFQSEGVVIIHNEHNIRWVRAKVNDVFRIKSKGRTENFKFKVILSRTIEQLPQEPIYNDVILIHPEEHRTLDFLGEAVLEKTE
jgi:hypothetical protein